MTNKNVTEFKAKLEEKISKEEAKKAIQIILKYIGEKKWTLKKFASVVKSKNRNLCAPPAPAEGLFLKKVLY